MKSISIYMTLIILFNINFRSVCVGGDKDKQSSGRGTTQEHGNKEETSKQNEEIENIQEPEKGTRNLDIKYSVEPREQMSAGNSLMKKHNDSGDYYWIIDRYDSSYERDYFNNCYFCDEEETDERLECCNCCEVL